MSSLVLNRLDYGNATLSGILGHLVQHHQSVMNAAARMICSTSRYSHITSILRQLQWLKARERIDFNNIIIIILLPASGTSFPGAFRNYE